MVMNFTSPDEGTVCDVMALMGTDEPNLAVEEES
jgi:hypothetical protein